MSDWNPTPYRPKCDYCGKLLPIAIEFSTKEDSINRFFSADYYCLPCMKERKEDKQ